MTSLCKISHFESKFRFPPATLKNCSFFQVSPITDIGPKASANFLLIYLAFCVSICLFDDQPTFASETREIKLAWDANTEVDLDGYQIYLRNGVSGSGYQLIAEIYLDELVDRENPMATITRDLSDNSKYYFAITSFDLQKNISNFSEEVCTDIIGSRVVACRVNEIIGYGGDWGSGVWHWESAEAKWIQMATKTPDGDIIAGDFTGDGKADVASVWSSGLWFQDGDSHSWTQVYHTVPARLAAGDITGDGVDEIIGSGGDWGSGVWYRDVASGTWHQAFNGSPPDGPIAVGDVTGDGKADIVSCWSNGLWYQDGATSVWTKVAGSAPDRLTAGDVTGDGRFEIIGIWKSGIWYFDVAASNWYKMSASSPTGYIAAGDFTGDGKADVASIWDNGLWYQDGATFKWTKVSNSSPEMLTTGDITGN